MPSTGIPQIIANAAAKNGVPPALALQVALQESSLNPSAMGKAGELGLFQLMPSTAASLGVTDPMDPAQNSAGGTAYLAQLYDKYGNWQTALIAYNWGPGNVDKYGVAAAPASTQQYASEALSSISADYTATMTPSSIAAGVTNIFTPADTAYDPTAEADAAATNDSGGETLIGSGASSIAVYIGIGLLAWILLQEVAEMF